MEDDQIAVKVVKRTLCNFHNMTIVMKVKVVIVMKVKVVIVMKVKVVMVRKLKI